MVSQVGAGIVEWRTWEVLNVLVFGNHVINLMRVFRQSESPALVSLLLPLLALAVSSFVNEIAGKAPEITQLACIDPVENAADKLSALT